MSLSDRLDYVGDETLRQLWRLARPLRGARILNLTASPFGVGPAELLSETVPLLRDLGLDAEWRFVAGDAGLSHLARKVYDGLSGRPVQWDPQSVRKWLLYSRLNARDFDGSHDIVVVHEPQLTALLHVLRESGREQGASRWVWHCHLDLRQARAEVWESLRPMLQHYDACVFSHPAFHPPNTNAKMLAVIPPAIDPSSTWNAELPRASVRRLLATQRIDPDRPIVLQVAPFSEPFGPLAAIEAVRRARVRRPDLQLVLIQPSAESAAETRSVAEDVARRAARDRAVRTVVAQGDTGSTLVNAAQRAASVVIQTSVPAGFAPHLWDAMWKGRPVLAGMSGGLPFQIENRVTGLTAEGEKGFAEAILTLLADPVAAARLGDNAREWVRRHHLLTRFLENELRLYGALLSLRSDASST